MKIKKLNHLINGKTIFHLSNKGRFTGMRLAFVGLGMLFFSQNHQLLADVVFLNNGDIISGKVKKENKSITELSSRYGDLSYKTRNILKIIRDEQKMTKVFLNVDGKKQEVIALGSFQHKQIYLDGKGKIIRQTETDEQHQKIISEGRVEKTNSQHAVRPWSIAVGYRPFFAQQNSIKYTVANQELVEAGWHKRDLSDIISFDLAGKYQMANWLSLGLSVAWRQNEWLSQDTSSLESMKTQFKQNVFLGQVPVDYFLFRHWQISNSFFNSVFDPLFIHLGLGLAHYRLDLNATRRLPEEGQEGVAQADLKYLEFNKTTNLNQMAFSLETGLGYQIEFNDSFFMDILAGVRFEFLNEWNSSANDLAWNDRESEVAKKLAQASMDMVFGFYVGLKAGFRF